MEITFAEVRFRRPHRKGSRIIFAARGEAVEALPKIFRHVSRLSTHESQPGDMIKIVHHDPTMTELEQGRLIVPRIPADSAIEISA